MLTSNAHTAVLKCASAAAKLANIHTISPFSQAIEANHPGNKLLDGQFCM